MKLSVKLMGIIFTGMVLMIILVNVLVYNFAKSSLEKAIAQNHLGTAEQTMNQIDVMLHERMVDIQAIAGEYLFVDQLTQGYEPRDNVTQRLKDLTVVTGPWDVLFVVDLSGRIVLSSNVDEMGRLIVEEPQSLLAFEASRKGDVYHSDLVISDDTHRPTIIYAAPIRDKNDPLNPVVGVVLANLAWPTIGEILDNMSSSYAIVINQNGDVIASNQPEMEIFGKNFYHQSHVREVLAGRSGTMNLSRHESFLGWESLVAYVPQKGRLAYRSNGWGLVYEVSSEKLLEAATKTARKLVLFLIPLMVFMSVVIYAMISRFVTRPITMLSGITRSVHDGDLSVKAPVLSKDEVGDLALSFNRMLDHLNHTMVSREWFEVMISSIGDAVIATDDKAIVTFMNSEAENLTGWLRSEVVGHKNITEVFNIINAQTRQKAQNPVFRVMKEGVVVGLANHTFLIRRDGTEIPIDDSGAPIRDKRGQIIGTVLVFRNVSEKYGRDQELVNTEKKFRAITDSTQNAIVSIDSNGRIVFWNLAATKIFGYEREEVMGRELTLIMPEKFREMHSKGLARFLKTGEKKVIGKTVELVGLKKSGEEFPLELTLSVWEKEKEVLFTGIMRDISQQKMMEKEASQLEIQLRAAQKLEAVGHLAAGIAHEINTPTQYIGDNTKFLQDSFRHVTEILRTIKSLVAEVRENRVTTQMISELEETYSKADMDYLLKEIPNAIQQSLEGVTRVSEIVCAMKEFSHPGGQEKRPVNINHALETTITVARNERKYVAEMETDFDREMPPVPCLPGEINQVFLNLIVNAAHAIGEKLKGEGKGKIRIETRKDGGWAKIRIGDSGDGIPEEIQERIFDPFFTTKEIGKGTGQGLPISRSVVVNKHGGTLTFESKPGEGTTFIIRLPFGS